jgi:hypothetical protein
MSVSDARPAALSSAIHLLLRFRIGASWRWPRSVPSGEIGYIWRCSPLGKAQRCVSSFRVSSQHLCPFAIPLEFDH